MEKREIELQLEVWRERQAHVKTSAHALNMQGQLLQMQSRECAAEVAKLEHQLAGVASETTTPEEANHAVGNVIPISQAGDAPTQPAPATA